MTLNNIILDSISSYHTLRSVIPAMAEHNFAYFDSYCRPDMQVRHIFLSTLNDGIQVNLMHDGKHWTVSVYGEDS